GRRHSGNPHRHPHQPHRPRAGCLGAAGARRGLMEKDPTPEILTAFLDGELPPEEMQRVAELLDARPDLDQWVRHQERLRADINHAFAALPPMPDRLVRTAMTSPISWRWRLRHMGLGAGLRILAPAGAALALGLVIGVALRVPSDIALRGG